jgi:DNA-binding transcriptional MerR regulator
MLLSALKHLTINPCDMTVYPRGVAEESKTAEMTIDQLARESGMTARNIRAHQSRGLVPSPVVRGRTGYYGPEHLARIELIQELQAEGFNLEAIRRLLEAGNGSSADFLRFTRAVREPFEDEEPEIVTLADLVRGFGDAGDPSLVRKAVRLGLLRPIGDERFEQLSPRLARAGQELSRLGVSPDETLEVASRLRRHADGVARIFTDLFLEHVWKPFDEAGRPPERWPEVVEALERLRPLASESLLAIFQLAMTDQVDKAFGHPLERIQREPRERSRSRRRDRSR